MYIDKKYKTENTKRIKDIMEIEGYIISINVKRKQWKRKRGIDRWHKNKNICRG